MVTVDTLNLVYAKLENRPGALEGAARVLGERRINIDALSLETQGTSAFARFVTHKPRETVEALRSAGVEAYESPSLVVSVPNKPGELARAAGEIAAAGINIEGVVTMPEGRLALKTSDNERAMQILRKH